MASWITVYLQDSYPNLNMSDIRKGIAPADWLTLGEVMGIEEDEVNAFMDNLEWKDDLLEIEQFGRRPIQIHTWDDPAEIKEQIEEISENSLPKPVKEHLESVKTIVALEFGFTQLGTMFEVVAFEIACWLAETKSGLICSPDDLWYDSDENRWQPIS